MSPPPTEGDTLDQLQSPEQMALLDTIDELRSQGLGHHGISLPQLIVCGDQSSGKSSLLEGLTRLRFPTDADICTVFATEVVLRRDNTVKISVEIMPSKLRSPAECLRLATFKRTYSTREDFPFRALHDEAKALMAGDKAPERGEVFEDVLRVRYSGPDMPSFTIVDLPGFIQQQWKGGDGAEKVTKLVTSYMSNEKSIILAVVAAKNDVDNQRIFTYVNQYDPKHLRTLGIITKPDKTDRGSNMEKIFLGLARNEEIPLKHRWHTVRNRDFEERDHSATERDEKEQQFFASGSWSILPRKDVGITALREKLSRVLLEHIAEELPSLMTAIDGAVGATESSLTALGHTRETTKEQRAYLTGHAEKFQMLTNDALRGIYSNRFFALATPDEHAPTRLRTAIQNLNIAFAHVMYRKGHTWSISADESSSGNTMSFFGDSNHVTQQYGTWFEDPMLINRAEFLENHIGEYVRQSRPSGLPSLVNPWVIGEVFRQQSHNWCKIAKHHLQQVFSAVKVYIEEALGSLVDPETRGLLMLKQIQPELDRRWRNVEAKLEELLVPYTEQDPITYDPGFLRELEEMRATRYRTKMETQSESVQKPFIFGQNNMNTTSNSSQRLLTESLDDFTNSEILDLMQTYYKVDCSCYIASLREESQLMNLQSAISVFSNNIAVLAIENCLIKDLSGIFSPTLTANMDDEQLYAIAAESEDVRYERSSLRKKLEVLQSGRQILYKHMGKSCPPSLYKDST
jgi:GTPase SAR1 family protein